MRRNISTEEQIGILQQAGDAVRVVDLCCQDGISDATIYKWQHYFFGHFSVLR